MKHVFLIESKKLVCNEAQLFTPESVSACLGIWKARFVRESREWCWELRGYRAHYSSILWRLMFADENL
jgi:hypothetical protein